MELALEEVKLGDHVAEPILAENGVTILEADVELTETHIELLKNKCISKVVVEREQRYTSHEMIELKAQITTQLKEKFRYFSGDENLKKSLMRIFYKYSVSKYED